MAAACSEACGHCGGCTASWEREAEDTVCEFCSWCNQEMDADVPTYPYCSTRCAAEADNDNAIECLR